MSVKKNAIVNYIKQIYVTLIGILILPFYMRYLGPAAFGLVGFYGVMQAWLRLLDMGFTPALLRQIAFIRGDSSQDYFVLKKLLRSLEILFFFVAILLVFGIYFSSHWIAVHWFISHGISINIVAHCVALMGVMFAFRWLNDLYFAGLCGFEKQLQCNLINIVIASFQYVGGWLFLRYFSHNVVYFFCFLTSIAGISLLLNAITFYRIIPSSPSLLLRISLEEIKKIFPFAMGSAYSAIVWVFVTQSDKLIFSHILSLTQYGYFSLVIIISGGIAQLSAPITQAILPRLTYYYSRKQFQDLLNLYCESTNWICVIIFSIVFCVATFSKPLLYAWSGSIEAANFGAPILFWYVLASAVLGVSGLQYSLQVANGSLRLHAYYNTVAAFIKIPIIIYTAIRYGVHATAITWFILMLLGFFLWVPIVHYRYAKGMHFRWLKNVTLLFLATFISGFLLKFFSLDFHGSRFNEFMEFALINFFLLVCVSLLFYLMRYFEWIR